MLLTTGPEKEAGAENHLCGLERSGGHGFPGTGHGNLRCHPALNACSAACLWSDQSEDLSRCGLWGSTAPEYGEDQQDDLGTQYTSRIEPTHYRPPNMAASCWLWLDLPLAVHSVVWYGSCWWPWTTTAAASSFRGQEGKPKVLTLLSHIEALKTA